MRLEVGKYYECLCGATFCGKTFKVERNLDEDMVQVYFISNQRYEEFHKDQIGDFTHLPNYEKGLVLEKEVEELIK